MSLRINESSTTTHIGGHSAGLLLSSAHSREHLLQLRVHFVTNSSPWSETKRKIPFPCPFRAVSAQIRAKAKAVRSAMDKFPVGLPLQVTMGAVKLSGVFYAYDPLLSLLVLTTALPPTTSQLATLLPSTTPGATQENRNYHLIKSSQITSLSVLSTTPTPALALPPPPALLQPVAVANRVKSALLSAEQSNQFEQLESLPEEMRQIVMSIRKTLPVRVQAGVVVVMEEVLIRFPYSLNDVKGNNKERVDRVKLVVRPAYSSSPCRGSPLAMPVGRRTQTKTRTNRPRLNVAL